MQTATMRDAIIAVIADQSGKKIEVSDSLTLGDLEMDSLDIVELCFAFEDRFDAVVDDDRWHADTTIEQVISEVLADLSQPA